MKGGGQDMTFFEVYDRWLGNALLATELCDSSVDCHTSHDRSEPSIMTGPSHLL